jgi:hypothetical protein
LRPKFRDPEWHDWIHRLPVEELLRQQEVKIFQQRVANLAGAQLPDLRLLSRRERRALRSFLNLQADSLEGVSVAARGRLYGIASVGGSAGLVGYIWSGIVAVAAPASIILAITGIAAVKVGQDARDIEASLRDVARIFRRIARDV